MLFYRFLNRMKEQEITALYGVICVTL